MKKILLASAIAALCSTSVLAADLGARPYTKAPAYVPTYNWTAIYVGGHVGASFGDNASLGVAGFNNTSTQAALIGGGQIGADYQFSPNWLVGIEGQISAQSEGARTFVSGVPNRIEDRTEWLGSVTGRLGYVWGPGVVYAKGGVAFRDNGGVAAFLPGGVATPFTTNRDDTGYTVGGGVEYMFAPSWSAKLEYQYYDFDRTNIIVPAFLAAPGGAYDSSIHTVKLGVNYRFNLGGPLVAKY